jgi:hypothetical protein
MTSRNAQRKARETKTASGKQGARGRRRQRSGGPQRNRIIAIAAVLLMAVAIVAVGLARRPQAPPATSSAEASAAIKLVTTVPAAALDAATPDAGVSPPVRIADGEPPLTQDGKPRVLYVGAEYCPYCAAQRWPLIVALSRFGTFDGLGVTSSSAADAYPNTPTFTFHGATYTSPYLAFTAVETADNTGAPLETPTSDQQALFQRFDGPPYASSSGAIPFLLLGNRYVQIGSSYQPDALAGMSRTEIARQLDGSGTSRASQEILGSANLLTAALCELTDGQPGDVCQAPGVTEAAASLPDQAP